MEQFSLEKYLANPSRKVVTGDGRPVRIICTDMKSYNEKIVGLIMSDTGIESIFTWTQQGKQYLNMDTPNDLFFAPKKGTGYVAVSKVGEFSRCVSGIVFDTPQEVKNATRDYIAIAKIEWEE